MPTAWRGSGRRTDGMTDQERIDLAKDGAGEPLTKAQQREKAQQLGDEAAGSSG